VAPLVPPLSRTPEMLAAAAASAALRKQQQEAAAPPPTDADGTTASDGSGGSSNAYAGADPPGVPYVHCACVLLHRLAKGTVHHCDCRRGYVHCARGSDCMPCRMPQHLTYFARAPLCEQVCCRDGRQQRHRARHRHRAVGAGVECGAGGEECGGHEGARAGAARESGSNAKAHVVYADLSVDAAPDEVYEQVSLLTFSCCLAVV
jgi:hypothetical protein